MISGWFATYFSKYFCGEDSIETKNATLFCRVNVAYITWTHFEDWFSYCSSNEKKKHRIDLIDVLIYFNDSKIEKIFKY